MKKYAARVLGTSVLLSGCSSREEADVKLAKGCEAGVTSLLAAEKYDHQIAKVNKVTYTMETLGRMVHLDTTTKNKVYGYEAEEKFSCIFSESYSMGYIAWNARLERITIGSDVIGRDDQGNIQGGLNEYMNLTDAVQSALDAEAE